MRKTAVALMAAVVSFVAVARGEVFCLCDEDPDDCGHACHECGMPVPDGVSGAEHCLHLEIASAELLSSEDAVGLPAVFSAPIATPPPVVVHFLRRDAAPCETSPPPWLFAYPTYSIRLFPRS